MTTTAETRETFQRSLNRAIEWVQRHHYRGYEPADGNSSFLFPLTQGRVFPMRVLQQVVLRAPFHIRPLLGISPHESAIGRGYMAWGYLRMCGQSPSPAFRREAASCLAWLTANRAAGFDDFCWGDPYDYATRSGRRPLGAPLLIWTALIGQAFLDAFDILEDDQYLAVARSVGQWSAKLPVERTEAGACLSYNTYSQESIHNSNAMGAAFLARLSAATGDEDAMALARAAMLYTCARQRPDGSWYYGEREKYHWIDNFHTGYNISALNTYRHASSDTTFDEHFVRGLGFFKSHFFETDGRPKYFHDRLYPIDIQCAAQAIDTLAAVSDDDPQSLEAAIKTAHWTIHHMQAPDGHFYYRHLGWTKVRTPMLHWGQGTMVKALAAVIEAIARQERGNKVDAA
jgi:rhamnogalacturonyl hydrolase YesR